MTLQSKCRPHRLARAWPCLLLAAMLQACGGGGGGGGGDDDQDGRDDLQDFLGDWKDPDTRRDTAGEGLFTKGASLRIDGTTMRVPTTSTPMPIAPRTKPGSRFAMPPPTAKPVSAAAPMSCSSRPRARA